MGDPIREPDEELCAGVADADELDSLHATAGRCSEYVSGGAGIRRAGCVPDGQMNFHRRI